MGASKPRAVDEAIQVALQHLQKVVADEAMVEDCLGIMPTEPTLRRIVEGFGWFWRKGSGAS
jgi:hypothetical protein